MESMKNKIPDFLQPGYKPKEAVLSRTKADRELAQIAKVAKAEGYIEAVYDLRQGLKKLANNDLLTLLEPAVRNLLLKESEFEKEVKK